MVPAWAVLEIVAREALELSAARFVDVSAARGVCRGNRARFPYAVRPRWEKPLLKWAVPFSGLLIGLAQAAMNRAGEKPQRHRRRFRRMSHDKPLFGHCNDVSDRGSWETLRRIFLGVLAIDGALSRPKQNGFEIRSELTYPSSGLASLGSVKPDWTR